MEYFKLISIKNLSYKKKRYTHYHSYYSISKMTNNHLGFAKSEVPSGQTSRMQNTWRQRGQVHFDDNHTVVSFCNCLDSYLKPK